MLGKNSFTVLSDAFLCDTKPQSTSQTAIKKKNSKVKYIIFQIIEEQLASKRELFDDILLTDHEYDYLKNVFQQCSMGKFPKGITRKSNGILKNKNYTLNINVQPEEITDNIAVSIVEWFKKHVYLTHYSNPESTVVTLENNSSNDDSMSVSSNSSKRKSTDISWKSIKNIDLRRKMFFDYLDTYCKEEKKMKNFTIEEKTVLFDYLKLYISCDRIKTSDITILPNYTIAGIKNISIEYVNGYIYMDALRQLNSKTIYEIGVKPIDAPVDYHQIYTICMDNLKKSVMNLDKNATVVSRLPTFDVSNSDID